MNPVKVAKVYHYRRVSHRSYEEIARNLRMSEKGAMDLLTKGRPLLEQMAEMHRKHRSYWEISEKFGFEEEHVREALRIWKQT